MGPHGGPPWGAQGAPGAWGPMGGLKDPGPRGMGLEDPWASRTRALKDPGLKDPGLKDPGPMGGPMGCPF